MYQTIYNITMNEVLKTHLNQLDLYLIKVKFITLCLICRIETIIEDCFSFQIYFGGADFSFYIAFRKYKNVYCN